jgi:glycosyltransferase involved in cell wall biosynthesis
LSWPERRTMNKYLLSVCVLTHNRAALLAQCLESISLQANASVEVVVSDNASTDNTREVVRGFQQKMDNLFYYRNDADLGGELNVFAVIGRARGEYVFLLGDDDLLTENALELVGRALLRGSAAGSGRTSRGSIGVVLSSRRIADIVSGRRLPPLEYFPEDRCFTPGAEALLGLFLPAHGLSGIVIRRNLIDLDGARRYLGSLYPQMYIVGRALKNAYGLYLKAPLVTVRLNAGNFWEYTSDFMTGYIIRMIYDLTENEPPRVRRLLISKRIRNAVFSLKTAKERSLKEFLTLVLACFGIREYRHSPVFWFYAFAAALFGNKMLNGLKRAVFLVSGNGRIFRNYLYGK